MQNANLPRARCVGALLAISWVMGSASQLPAAPLAPGGVVSPVPASSLAGDVIHDELIPFEMHDPGNVLVYKGVLQNRVLRLGDGKLAFGYRVRDTQEDLSGRLTGVDTESFTGFSTDVSYGSTSLGTTVPSRASRDISGSSILFELFAVASGGESKFMWIATDAKHFRADGSTTLTTSLGYADTVPTVEPVDDDTPPIAEITDPVEPQCVCNPVTIKGSAYDPDGTFESYTLEYRRIGDPNWVLIVNGHVPVINGVLGVWNTAGLSEGYYLIRLTVMNTFGLSATDTVLIWVETSPPGIDLRSPKDGDIVGGKVCFDGTVNDHCLRHYTVEYAPAGGGAFSPVDPANPVYTTGVINDPFAVWDTQVPGVPDGQYRIRITAFNVCGQSTVVMVNIVVDNTAPTAIITSPTNCDYVHGLVKIIGTANDANLAGWAVQYTGGGMNGWVTIASGNTPVIDDVLATWDTTSLEPCAYTLRLLVSDKAVINCNAAIHHTSEFTVSVNVGICGEFDLDTDGDVDGADLLLFEACETGPATPYDPNLLPAGCGLIPVGSLLPVDLDGDSDLDQVDFAYYQSCFSGSGSCIPHVNGP